MEDLDVESSRGFGRYPPIVKRRDRLPVPPNLHDYDAVCRDFSWEGAGALLSGLPGGGLNIAFEAVDRHARGARAEAVALRFLAADGGRREMTFRQLGEETSRFANLLESLGIRPGERVFVLAGRIPELYIAVLGALKARALVCPLFSAFGPEPLLTRMQLGDARVLVTTGPLYRRKAAALRAQLPGLAQVILAGPEAAPAEPGVLAWDAALAGQSAEYEIGPTAAEDPALLHFTSGTTGRPKGALHVHRAVLTHCVTGRYVLDLHDDDVFWCTADPGWVTGMSYGIIAPLALGVISVVVEAEFDAGEWSRILREERISVWYTAPTAIRMMMKLGDALAGQEFPRLRFLASVGEPLNPEAVVWSSRVFGQPFHDNWWQTETGGIMIANFAGETVKPGSMGRPIPGVEAALVRRLADGGVEPVAGADAQGELALRRGWPSLMVDYLNEHQRYLNCFAGDWYLTGDLARRDADGYYWFVGRADDLIKSSGHLIGPFEVESALLEHPAVAEAGVIGMPDPVAGEVVKAFVALRPGRVADDALRRELLGHARKRLGAAVAPKEIAFRDNLPKTRSGKILRRLLRARELGLPEGDLSTLESDER